MNKKYVWKEIVSIILIVLSSLVQVFAIQTFVLPSRLLSSGFTGLAILSNQTLQLLNIDFSVSLGIILFNIPAIMLCLKSANWRFIARSILQLTLTSFLLRVLDFQPVFTDIILNCLIGGVVYGMCTVLALKADGSTGGTDFVAMYVANKTGKSIWSYVFLFNVAMLVVFGFLFGFEYAGYSIVFQFASTKTIERFHHRYDQMTLQITTYHPDKVIAHYTRCYRHGITVSESYGGYSGKKLYLCHTVVSSYEISDIVRIIRKEDPKAIINVLKTEDFYGGFYRHPIGEYTEMEE